jgi:hypothetical protein
VRSVANLLLMWSFRIRTSWQDDSSATCFVAKSSPVHWRNWDVECLRLVHRYVSASLVVPAGLWPPQPVFEIRQCLASSFSGATLIEIVFRCPRCNWTVSRSQALLEVMKYCISFAVPRDWPSRVHSLRLRDESIQLPVTAVALVSLDRRS